MENIFIFIIIMIISSLISKNKKNAAEKNTTGKPVTRNNTHKNKSGLLNDIKPVTDLKEFLDRLNNEGSNHEGTSDLNSQNYDAVEDQSEYQQQTDNVQDSQDTEQQDRLEEMLQYSRKRTGDTDQEISFNGERIIAGEVPSEEYTKEDTSYDIKKKENRFSKILDSRSKLKNAIIVSEILNRRYT
ncbi:MAG: hypothetical protein R6V47_07785 [Candidatus Delongbacteria bacterium]